MVILDGVKIVLKKNMTLEGLVSQLQPHTNKYLVVEDGTILHIFDNPSEFPAHLELEHIDSNRVSYFRQKKSETLFALFDELRPFHRSTQAVSKSRDLPIVDSSSDSEHEKVKYLDEVISRDESEEVVDCRPIQTEVEENDWTFTIP